jgi:hypothetical protein
MQCHNQEIPMQYWKEGVFCESNEGPVEAGDKACVLISYYRGDPQGYVESTLRVRLYNTGHLSISDIEDLEGYIYLHKEELAELVRFLKENNLV